MILHIFVLPEDFTAFALYLTWFQEKLSRISFFKAYTKLAIDTLDMAAASRNISEGLIFHRDRGCQFTSEAFRRHLDELNIVQSFSAKGHPYDNAVMECFFKYLKKEETNRRTYSSFDELKLSIFQYIHGFYNSFRPHSHNNGLSPD